jgi:hypothetical protein
MREQLQRVVAAFSQCQARVASTRWQRGRRLPRPAWPPEHFRCRTVLVAKLVASLRLPYCIVISGLASFSILLFFLQRHPSFLANSDVLTLRYTWKRAAWVR